MSIYTPTENPTVQIYVGSPDVDPGTYDVNRKHCTQRVRSPREQVSVGTPGKRRDFRWSELPTIVGTSDEHNLNKQPAQLMPGLPASVRSVSELPANVGTSDGRNSQRTSGLPTSTDSEPVRSIGDGTSGLGRDFRLSVVPTYVGTSDVDSHRNLFYVLVKCKSVTHLILFNCLSTLSSSDQLNLHPSL